MKQLGTEVSKTQRRTNSRGGDLLQITSRFQESSSGVATRLLCVEPYGSTNVHFSLFALSHSATNDHQLRSFLPL